MTTKPIHKTEERLIAQARKSGTVVATGHEKRVPLLKLVTKGLMREIQFGIFVLTEAEEDAKNGGEEKSK